MLADRLPGLRLAEGQSLRFSPNISFRGPLEMWVEWDVAAGSATKRNVPAEGSR
jgi:hypothetical protein